MPKLAVILEEEDRMHLARVAFEAAVKNSGGPETIRDWDQAHAMTKAMYLVIAEQVAQQTLFILQQSLLDGRVNVQVLRNLEEVVLE